MIRTIALAYSGGLDTSIIIPWLKENYAYDVIAMVGDVGQGDDIEGVVQKAYDTGAHKVLVEDLRETTIPQGLQGTSANAYVGGQTAGYIDLATQIADKLPLMIAIVVGLSFIVLLLAFRSLLVPVKAAAMNLLSVAAAYGVVTAVFQLGWGSSLIGLDHSIPIVSFVPLLMFAILFGLSMDYEVFLLTQMREHFTKYGDEKRAVPDVGKTWFGPAQ